MAEKIQHKDSVKREDLKFFYDHWGRVLRRVWGLYRQARKVVLRGEVGKDSRDYCVARMVIEWARERFPIMMSYYREARSNYRTVLYSCHGAPG